MLAAAPIPRNGPVSSLSAHLIFLSSNYTALHFPSSPPTPQKVIAEHCRPLENHISTGACGVAILSIVRTASPQTFEFFFGEKQHLALVVSTSGKHKPDSINNSCHLGHYSSDRRTITYALAKAHNVTPHTQKPHDTMKFNV